MASLILAIVNLGVTIAFAVIGALVIQPLRDIRGGLADVVERLAFIEGRMKERDGEDWRGAERRRERR